MTIARAVPERGWIVYLHFDPSCLGREQAGRRPAVVMSPSSYNSKAGLAVMCPITTKKKGYPFEVDIPAGLPVSGVILSDHLKSVDWSLRAADFVCSLPNATVQEVAARIIALVADP